MDVLERESFSAQENRAPVVNDFSLVAATVNGTGSQTANLTLLRAFFKMGIPVHGKNIFPSNIQGLPTWYNIRVSFEGYVARRPPELLVAFNPTTVSEDVKNLPPGGVCIYNTAIKGIPQRDDLTYYGLPVDELIKDVDVPVKRKPYIANMVYVGAVAQLLGIELDFIEEALGAQFGRRQKLVDSNMNVVKGAFDWTAQNLGKNDPYRVEPMNENRRPYHDDRQRGGRARRGLRRRVGERLVPDYAEHELHRRAARLFAEIA